MKIQTIFTEVAARAIGTPLYYNPDHMKTIVNNPLDCSRIERAMADRVTGMRASPDWKLAVDLRATEIEYDRLSEEPAVMGELVSKMRLADGIYLIRNIQRVRVEERKPFESGEARAKALSELQEPEALSVGRWLAKVDPKHFSSC